MELGVSSWGALRDGVRELRSWGVGELGSWEVGMFGCWEIGIGSLEFWSLECGVWS